MWGKGRVEFNDADNSIGKITNNTFSGEVGNITAGIGNTTIVRENSPGGNDMQQISDREWVELARFFWKGSFLQILLTRNIGNSMQRQRN